MVSGGEAYNFEVIVTVLEGFCWFVLSVSC